MNLSPTFRNIIVVTAIWLSPAPAPLVHAGDLTVDNLTVNQNVLISGKTTGTANQGVVFKGTLNVGGIPATGPGPRMMWYPGKAAFRVGWPNGSEWDDANVGLYSVAMGALGKASGSSAVALGTATASGVSSGAWGQGAQATGDQSFALGYVSEAAGGHAFAATNSRALNNFTTAIGGAIASGDRSTALGILANASGAYSTAFVVSTASGSFSTAMGYSIAASDYATASGASNAGGYQSTAFGGGWATGNYSAAIGLGTVAQGMNSFVVGTFNQPEGSPGTNVPADPAFVVGIGTGNPNDPPEVAKRNGFVVRKDGTILMPKQGDISMGEFQ